MRWHGISGGGRLSGCWSDPQWLSRGCGGKIDHPIFDDNTTRTEGEGGTSTQGKAREKSLKEPRTLVDWPRVGNKEPAPKSRSPASPEPSKLYPVELRLTLASQLRRRRKSLVPRSGCRRGTDFVAPQPTMGGQWWGRQCNDQAHIEREREREHEESNQLSKLKMFVDKNNYDSKRTFPWWFRGKGC